MKKYFLVFGDEKFHPEDHYNAAIKFDFLKDAREAAKHYINASLFRMYENGSIQEKQINIIKHNI